MWMFIAGICLGINVGVMLSLLFDVVIEHMEGNS